MNLGQMKRPWQADSGPNRYRRGLYTFFWRATPHPFLTTFDAPFGVQTCTRRFRSNTPLQALTMLNDPAFVEIAAGLAERILSERPDPASDRDRLRHGIMLCLGRPAVDSELDMLENLLEQERGCLGPSPTAGPAADRPPGDRVLRLRTWVTVARVLLNLDEFVTRE